MYSMCCVYSVLHVENDDESQEPECLEGVHLMFDSEAADLLPMVIR